MTTEKLPEYNYEIELLHRRCDDLTLENRALATIIGSFTIYLLIFGIFAVIALYRAR